MKKLLPILCLALLSFSNMALAQDNDQPGVGAAAAGGCAAFAFGTAVISRKLGTGVLTAAAVGCAGGAVVGVSMGAAMANEAPSTEYLDASEEPASSSAADLEE